jgi:hypothetical protein
MTKVIELYDRLVATGVVEEVRTYDIATLVRRCGLSPTQAGDLHWLIKEGI